VKLGTSVVLNGTVYPSKTEASWAAYFDRIEITAFHEPVRVAGYYPDFFLPDYLTFVEVKNGHVEPEDLRKWTVALLRLQETSWSDVSLLVINGHPPGKHWLELRAPDEVPVTVRRLGHAWRTGSSPRIAVDWAGVRVARDLAENALPAEDHHLKARKELLKSLPVV